MIPGLSLFFSRGFTVRCRASWATGSRPPPATPRLPSTPSASSGFRACCIRECRSITGKYQGGNKARTMVLVRKRPVSGGKPPKASKSIFWCDSLACNQLCRKRRNKVQGLTGAARHTGGAGGGCGSCRERCARRDPWPPAWRTRGRSGAMPERRGDGRLTRRKARRTRLI